MQGFHVETEQASSGRFIWTAYFQMGSFKRQVCGCTTDEETAEAAQKAGERALVALVAHVCRSANVVAPAKVPNGTVVGRITLSPERAHA